MFYWFFWKITVFSFGCEDNVLETPYTAMRIPKEILCLASIQNTKLIQQWRAGDCILYLIALNSSQRTLHVSAPLLQEVWKISSPMNIYHAASYLRSLLSLQMRDKGLKPLKLGWSLKLMPLNDSEHSCCTLCAAQSWSCVTCALPRHSWKTYGWSSG